MPDDPATPAPQTPPEASLLKRLWALISTFAVFGGVTFGGGYAIVALLEDRLVRQKGWLTSDELLDIITIGESTPGPIAVNTATFVGYRVAGVLGGIVATVSLVFPAWLVIVLISSCYLILRENYWIAAALAGVRIAAIVLIARAFLRMGKKIAPTPTNLIASAVAFGLIVFLKTNAVWIIVASLLFGIFWYGIRPRYLDRRKAERAS